MRNIHFSKGNNNNVDLTRYNIHSTVKYRQIDKQQPPRFSHINRKTTITRKQSTQTSSRKNIALQNKCLFGRCDAVAAMGCRLSWTQGTQCLYYRTKHCMCKVCYCENFKMYWFRSNPRSYIVVPTQIYFPGMMGNIPNTPITAYDKCVCLDIILWFTVYNARNVSWAQPAQAGERCLYISIEAGEHRFVIRDGNQNQEI